MNRQCLGGRRLAASYAAAVLMLLAPDRARAQTVLGLPAGVRVRIAIADSLRQAPFSPRHQRVIANLLRETPDSLFLSIGGSDPVGIARARTGRIDVSNGVSRARSAGVQALALAGVAAVAVFATGSSSDDRNGSDDRRGSDILTAGAIGFGIGAVLGAVSPFETWRRVRTR